MNQSAKQPSPIDLDDLERQLREAASGPARPAAQPERPSLSPDDPLAELARIVGQKDPFRDLLSADRAPSARPQARPAAGSIDDDFERSIEAALRLDPTKPLRPEPVAAPPVLTRPAPEPRQEILARQEMPPRQFAPQHEVAPPRQDMPRQDMPRQDMPRQDMPRQDTPRQDMPREEVPREDIAPRYVPAAMREPEPDLQPEAEPEPFEVSSPVTREVEPIRYPRRDSLAARAEAVVPPPPPPPGARAVDLDEAYELRGTSAPDRPGHAPLDEPFVADPQLDPYSDVGYPPEEPPRRTMSRGLITLAALGGIAVVGLVGALVFKGVGTGPSGEPPVIKADDGPSRVRPATQGAAPEPQKQVLDRAGDAPRDANLVERQEQPVDVVQAARSAQPRVVLPPPGGQSSPPPAGLGVVPAPAGGQDAAPSQPAPNPAVAALGEPRRVRTVTIRPDGTVVTGATGGAAAGASVPAMAALAPPAAAPAAPAAASPAVPAVPAAPAEPAASEGTGGPATTPPPPARPRAEAAPAPAARPAARPAAPARAPASAPLSIATPAGAARTVGVNTAAAPSSAAAAPSAGGAFVVQVNSSTSEADARAQFTSLQRRFPEQLGGRTPTIRRADLGSRGTFYRVRVGGLSREEANRICEGLKAGGAGCFIQRN
jgi:hypothetical protein